MKKRWIIFSWLLICFGCQKEPDTSKLDNDFPVITDHDTNAVFSSYTTYYIPDSVLVINSSENKTYWTDSRADDIVGAFVRNMNSRGYTEVDKKENADLGLQVSYIEDNLYFADYDDYPYWWWDYPGYWGSGYWGGYGGGWYYPYSVYYYSYSVGSLLAEMVDLKGSRTDNKLPVIWSAHMSGLLSSSNNVNVQLAVRAVDQAFAQSSYIKK